MKKPTTLGISRSGGARNPHVFQYTLRFLRSDETRPPFARDGFFTNSEPLTKRGALGVVALLLMLAAAPASAAGIMIKSAALRLVNGFYLLDASLEFKLSKESLEALDNGVALELLIETELRRERAFLWDERIATVKQGYRLERHALSKTYVIVNLITGDRQNFTSLADARAGLGKIRGVPILERRWLSPGRGYHARVRASLDIESVPAPVRLIAYFSSGWRLSSAWFEWSLTV